MWVKRIKPHCEDKANGPNEELSGGARIVRAVNDDSPGFEGPQIIATMRGFAYLRFN